MNEHDCVPINFIYNKRQWATCCLLASTAGDMGSKPGQGTKISHSTTQPSPPPPKKNLIFYKEINPEYIKNFTTIK